MLLTREGDKRLRIGPWACWKIAGKIIEICFECNNDTLQLKKLRLPPYLAGFWTILVVLHRADADL